MTDFSLFSTLIDCIRQGGSPVLCTIVDSAGSAPRGAGARMALLPDGTWLGTVGGGAVENLVQQRASVVMDGTAQGGLVVPARTVVPCRWPGRIGQAAQAGKKTHSRLPCRVPGPSSLLGSTPRNVSRCWRQGPRRCRAS